MGKFVHHFDDQSHNKLQRSRAKAKKNPIKVKYISSPTKVKAGNASEFRAIVQELTGKNSTVNDHNTYDAVLALVEETNYQAADPHTKNVSPAADKFFTSHLSSVDHQFQCDHERFFRTDSAGSSFGFQSPNFFPLYDYNFTAI